MSTPSCKIMRKRYNQQIKNKQVKQTKNKTARVKWNHEKNIIPAKKPPRGDKTLYMHCFEFFIKSNQGMVLTPLISKSDYAMAKASYQCQDGVLSC